MPKKRCEVCAQVGNDSNNARNMRLVHHIYHCSKHRKYVMALEYANDFAEPAEDKLAGNEAGVVEYGNDFAEPAEDELVGNEAEAVEHDNDFAQPAEDELVSNGAEVVEYDDDSAESAEDELVGNEAEVVEDIANMLAELDLTGNEAEVGDGFAAEAKLVGKKAEELCRFRPKGYDSLPAIGTYASNPNEPRPRLILRPEPVNPEHPHMPVRQQREECWKLAF
ncbi:hypothetical protein FN846DRAFT_886200 [Sphaerosporella brunnea]|uniref:Uncharacterized protein n=1 Tax=Sphaerosporella brunnea TaxID=1250544 RepID=A0A5J5FAH3_9PEZI|nr:hypothetical protein FN846DRAFT_886200 [Sphaerosporella brunnea]